MRREQLEESLERLHSESFAWAMGCCRRDRAEAEDVLQEAYLKILEGRARFDGRSSLKTFLFSVIGRTAAQRRRSAFWRRLLPMERSSRWAHAVEPQAAESAEDLERRLLVARGLDALARRQRETLLLVFAHGFTVEEAARAMRISVGSARVHYQRGKARLAVLLRGGR